MPCATRFGDTSGRVSTDLAGATTHVCLRTAEGEIACWGSDLHQGESGLMDLCEGDHAAWPFRLGLHGSQLAVSSSGTCTLDGGGVSCTSAVHSMLRPTGAPAANGAIDALHGARRIAIVNRGICGVFQDEVRCAINWGKTMTRSRLLGRHFAVADAEADKTYALGFVPFPGATLLAAGLGWACATDAAGAPWCWGDDWFGTLGQGGGVSDSDAPLRVGTLTGVRSMETDGATICAVTKENDALCWGSRAKEWGTADASGVVRLPFADVRSVTIGEQFVCALGGRGGVRCIGKGTKMFSIGEAPAFSAPVEQLASGGAYLCARLQGSAVECLGMEGYLGDGAPLPKRLANPLDFEATIRGRPVRIFPNPRP